MTTPAEGDYETMALTQETEPQAALAGCPVDHADAADKKSCATRAAARPRWSATRQASGMCGASTRRAPSCATRNPRRPASMPRCCSPGRPVTNRPILYQEGKVHQEQRKQDGALLHAQDGQRQLSPADGSAGRPPGRRSAHPAPLRPEPADPDHGDAGRRAGSRADQQPRRRAWRPGWTLSSQQPPTPRHARRWAG